MSHDDINILLYRQTLLESYITHYHLYSDIKPNLTLNNLYSLQKPTLWL